MIENICLGHLYLKKGNLSYTFYLLFLNELIDQIIEPQ